MGPLYLVRIFLIMCRSGGRGGWWLRNAYAGSYSYAYLISDLGSINAGHVKETQYVYVPLYNLYSKNFIVIYKRR